jgi:tetratricopeptide (TPR) repeat protein
MVAVVALAAMALASPGFSQTTGMCKGKVVDAKGQPIENAKVTIEFKEGINRKYEVKTNRRGEFMQIGLQPGQYTVTAEKEKLGRQSFDVRVRLGDPAEVNFVLDPSKTMPTAEDAAKSAAIKAVFDEGVIASRGGNHDLAIEKFNEAATLLPNCYDCYYNIGFAQTQKRDYVKAEEAFKKAIELKADYIEAYNGLATVYNAQKRFEDAQAASAKAAELAAAAGPAGGAGAAGVDALYNQGVIAWNAGKVEEAMAKFQEALKVNPDHADSHYQIGMGLLNQGKLQEAVAEFETYLKLAPDGGFAAQAKAIVAQIKK